MKFTISKCPLIKKSKLFEMKIRLGPKQLEFLGRVCQSNGGGVCPKYSEQKIIDRLYELGLIQGKPGQQYCVVHTTAGLNHWRGHEQGR